MQEVGDRGGCAPSARNGRAVSPEIARAQATIERRRAEEAARARQARDRQARARRAARDKAKRDLRLASARARDVERVMKFVHYDFGLPWPEADPERGLPRLTNNHRLVFLLVLGCNLAGWRGVCTTVRQFARKFSISESTVKEAFRRLAVYGLAVRVNNHDPAHAERHGLPSHCTQLPNTYRLGEVGEVLLRWARQQIDHAKRCKAPETDSSVRSSDGSSTSRPAVDAVRSVSPYKGGENRRPMLSVDQSIEGADLGSESASPTDPGGKPPSNPATAPLPRRRLTRAEVARSGPGPSEPPRSVRATRPEQRDKPPLWRTAWTNALAAFDRRGQPEGGTVGS